MALNKNQHFVSRHYLRQFRVAGQNDLIVVSTIEPFRCIGAHPIGGQCQEDYFYGYGDSKADAMLKMIEGQVAPVLVRVAKNESFAGEDVSAIRLLVVELHQRTRKAAEAHKVFPKFMADEILKSAIENGELPIPPSGWRPGLMDFGGVPQSLVGLVLPLYLETMTLRVKLLRAAPGAFFITSDHPVVAMNQFAADAKGIRSCVGFAQAGFQLILPLSPTIATVMYDPFVYKVGERRESCVEINPTDVEVLNALQIQSAEKCVYSHSLKTAAEIGRLVNRFGKLRVPIDEGLTQYPGPEPGETLIQFRAPRIKLPTKCTFVQYRRRIRKNVGDRRDPAFSALIQEIDEDLRHNPNGGGLDERLDRIIAAIPPDRLD